MKYFDGYLEIGKRTGVREGAVNTAEDILRIMDKLKIEKALVCHFVSQEISASRGNELLMKEIAGNDRFLPQWVVEPDIMKPDEFIDKMKRNRVTSARIYPKTSGFVLEGEIFKKLEACRIPVFVNKSEIEPDSFYEFLKRYPHLKTVLCSIGYGVALPPLMPLFEKCHNLYADTSNYCEHMGISDFVRKFGAERMIFGTSLPYGSACGAVSLLGYAEISAEDKAKIAYKNLEKLLSEVAL